MRTGLFYFQMEHLNKISSRFPNKISESISLDGFSGIYNITNPELDFGMKITNIGHFTVFSRTKISSKKDPQGRTVLRADVLVTTLREFILFWYQDIKRIYQILLQQSKSENIINKDNLKTNFVNTSKPKFNISIDECSSILSTLLVGVKRVVFVTDQLKTVLDIFAYFNKLLPLSYIQNVELDSCADLTSVKKLLRATPTFNVVILQNNVISNKTILKDKKNTLVTLEPVRVENPDKSFYKEYRKILNNDNTDNIEYSDIFSKIGGNKRIKNKYPLKPFL